MLVERVSLDPRVSGILAWHGRKLRPGETLSRAELFEGAPAGGPLLLEQTETLDPSFGTRRRWTLLMVLWRYDPRKSEWSEIARVAAPETYGGVMELRQLASRMLGHDAWREMESLSDSAERIHSYLRSELRQLGDRSGPVLEMVLHQILGGMLDAGRPLPRFLPSGSRLGARA